MDVEILPAQSAHRPLLRQLIQLYLYDFTAYLDIPMDDDGRYPADDFEDFGLHAGQHTFLFRVESRWAGFAMVEDRRHNHAVPPESRVIEMDEFFVLRHFRGKGVGRHAAHALFNRFRGQWRVAQISSNIPAIAFWREVIGHYTDGAYAESTWSRTGRTGVAQGFDNSAAP